MCFLRQIPSLYGYLPRYHFLRWGGCWNRAQIARQLDDEGSAFAWLALNANSSTVIANYRLHDRQAQARAVLLVRVIRSKNTLALLAGQSATRIADFDGYFAILVACAQR